MFDGRRMESEGTISGGLLQKHGFGMTMASDRSEGTTFGQILTDTASMPEKQQQKKNLDDLFFPSSPSFTSETHLSQTCLPLSPNNSLAMPL